MNESVSLTNGVKGLSPGTRSGNALVQVRGAVNFEQVLEQAQREMRLPRFSAHALARLEQRQIHLTSKQMDEIGRAMARAREKGARQSLLLYGDLAMVASIGNNTIVTALNGAEMKERVFTNIDSAVII